MISVLVCFVEPPDKNKARWKTSPFWDDFNKGSKPIKTRKKSRSETISWVIQICNLAEKLKMGDFDLELLKIVVIKRIDARLGVNLIFFYEETRNL